MKSSLLVLPSAILLFTCLGVAQTLEPGGPGKDAYWATAAKQGIGTSATLESKVWFTLADGVMTEVYYPDVTTANVHMLQFVIVNPKTKKVETERDDANHKIEVGKDSLSFTQISTAKDESWRIVKIYTIDPARNTVLISVDFAQTLFPSDPKKKEKRDDPDFDIYVYYDPSLANTGMHDSGRMESGTLVVSDGDKFSALQSKAPFENATTGFLGSSDGLTQIRNGGKIEGYARADNGNIVQFAKLTEIFPSTDVSAMAVHSRYKIALSFGKTSEEAIRSGKASLAKGFEKCQAEYEKGWVDFVKMLPKVDPKYQAQFNMAAMVLKAQEDKTVRGANVASLTIPWGGGKNANTDVGGGYHLVWARDLYEVFTAYMALGDKAAANRALDFLFNIQQKPDGSFPQNSWLDGRNGWGGLQMDEVGYPLIMAWQLVRFDKQTYEKHVKPAADFIVKNGPTTPQERWEEKGGYSPSTIAAEIAGLVCAADIAKRNGDQASADLYLKTADEWQANIEKWTATTNGPYGDGHYYLRLTQGHPDAGEKIELNNGAGTFKENEIVDAGFLELVRLGIKPADDPLIAKSVKVVDQQIKVDTPNGEGFYRYSHDGYGEMDDGRRWNFDGKYTGRGRPWPLLSGERGQYELALHEDYLYKVNHRFPLADGVKLPSVKPSIEYLVKAQNRLKSMAAFGNEGLMIPEQVWDKKETPANRDREFVPELKFGEGTGSATPLAWSMAQFIRLAMNLKAGKNLDTPQVVYDRYVAPKAGTAAPVELDSNDPGAKLSSPITADQIKALPTNSPVVSGQKIDPVVQSKEASVDIPDEFPVDGPDDNCDSNKTAFWRERDSIRFPLVKKCSDGTYRASFAYSGDAKDVQIAGDFSGWKPYSSFNKPEQAPERSKFNKDRFISLEFKPTARVEYKLIVDGKWITDPLNPNKIDNGVGGENSVFTMPDYKPTEWDKGSISGKLETLEIASKVLNDTRKVQVYAPPLPEKVQQSLKMANPMYPVMYVQDGSDYIKRAKAIEIQENLVKAKKVRPFIMVFLDPKDRNKEYWANDDYAKYLATEVVPAVDKQYTTYPYPEFRVVIGASLGGVTSVWTAMKYPDVFGRVGGQSSSFWIDGGRVVKGLEKLDFLKTKLKFYLDAGTLEGTADTEKVVKILRDRHYEVVYYSGETGHNWTAWRDRLADAFIALFGNKILPR
ncbi:MAG: glycoside hydrolase family 15 protein [Acidobacteriota bacterium]